MRVSEKHTVESVFADTGFKVRNPLLVIQLGLVYDNYKQPQLSEIWKKSERMALTKMPTFKKEHFFYQSDLTKTGENLWYSFRYYTPPENIISRPQSDA
jgi:hypothetical protein